ncbi:MAG: L-threonylcarbamoyladenylate synthase [Candidatus Binatia bacterium]
MGAERGGGRASRDPEVELAAEVLRRGGIVVYPTETVYGLGADASSPKAMASFFRIKGREIGRGVSVLVSGLAMASSYLRDEPPADARALAEAFWPGPLTLVLPASDALVSSLCGETGGLGLRCSSDPVACELLSMFGKPISASSANTSGGTPARSVGEAKTYFGAEVGFYLDGGPRPQGQASTVVEFLGDRAYLRRAGAVTVAALDSVLSTGVYVGKVPSV